MKKFCGIRLLRKPKAEKPRWKEQEAVRPARHAEKKPYPGMSFTDGERLQEWKNIAEQDYVPTNGPFLWKYRGKTSGGRGFALEMNGFLIAAIAGVLIFCTALLFFIESLGNTKSSMWLATFLIFAMTGVIGYCALHIGGRANSKQLAFVRTDNGAMYLLDYRSPEFRDYCRSFQLHLTGVTPLAGALAAVNYVIQSLVTAGNVRRIDELQIIENMMACGRVSLYGRRIRQVKSVDRTALGYRIYCVLLRPDGTDWHTSFLLSKSYKHFDELLYNLERLKTDHSFEQGVCHICGTRLVGGICPLCGPANGRKLTKTQSRYAKHERLVQILCKVTGALCIASMIGCIITYQMNQRADYTYEKVNAIVETCEEPTNLQKMQQKKPRVTVRYENHSYQLKNVTQGSWYYPVGTEKEVYLSRGVMYANEAGVTSSGPTAKLYYGFLFGFMGMVTAYVILIKIRKEIRMETM